jgi:uncharacterized protein with PIN domain
MSCFHERAVPVEAKIRSDRTIATSWRCSDCNGNIRFIVMPANIKHVGNTTVSARDYYRKPTKKVTNG